MRMNVKKWFAAVVVGMALAGGGGAALASASASPAPKAQPEQVGGLCQTVVNLIQPNVPAALPIPCSSLP